MHFSVIHSNFVTFLISILGTAYTCTIKKNLASLFMFILPVYTNYLRPMIGHIMIFGPSITISAKTIIIDAYPVVEINTKNYLGDYLFAGLR